MRRALFLVPAAGALALAVAGLRTPPVAADGTSPPHLERVAVLTSDLRQQTLDGYTVNAEGKKLNDAVSDRLIHWKQDGWAFAENRTLCSQHISVVMKATYGWTDSQYGAKVGSSWPTAEGYYNAIRDGRGFTKINTHWEWAPGDVIAMSYKDDPNSGYPGTTGHCSVLNCVGPKIQYTFSNGTTVWFRDIEIFDSTSAVHSLDTRIFLAGELGSGSAYTEWKGAGRAWMRVYVDAADNLAGYTWSMTGNKQQAPGTPSSWTYYSNNFKSEALRHVNVGRIQAP